LTLGLLVAQCRWDCYRSSKVKFRVVTECWIPNRRGQVEGQMPGTHIPSGFHRGIRRSTKKL